MCLQPKMERKTCFGRRGWEVGDALGAFTRAGPLLLQPFSGQSPWKGLNPQKGSSWGCLGPSRGWGLQSACTCHAAGRGNSEESPLLVGDDNSHPPYGNQLISEEGSWLFSVTFPFSPARCGLSAFPGLSRQAAPAPQSSPFPQPSSAFGAGCRRDAPLPRSPYELRMRR